MRPGLVAVQGGATVFPWWDDAITYATRLAARTGRRQTVKRWHQRAWAVIEVDA